MIDWGMFTFELVGVALYRVGRALKNFKKKFIFIKKSTL